MHYDVQSVAPMVPYPTHVGGDNMGLGGGGLLGGLLLGSLLRNNNGLFGTDGNVNGVSANHLQSSIDTNAILESLGDIKASVPLAEAQVQLALAGAQSDITQQNQAQTIALSNQAFAGQLANVQGFSNTKDAVDALSTQTAIGFGVVNTGIERTGWQLANTVKDDGEKTRALITANQIAELNRIAQERQDEIIELRNNAARDRDRRDIEITMINNQNQNQLQFQQQQQILGTLAGCLSDVSQLARATNQSLIIGNSGTVHGGSQAANPTNVRV